MSTRIYDPRGECDPGATIRKFRFVQTEGSRQVDNARAAISKAEGRS